MNKLHIDRAAECVKNIVDNNRCPLCDRADGHRLRYSCGHVACDDCIITAEDCLLCLTPPKTSNSAIIDKEFTKRVENTSSLLKAWQSLFNIDVYKRQRLSEQQKIEKELFPQCIQAPMKYENKRKSSIRLSKDKENRSSLFLGESISPIKDNKMENSVSYVQQWLNKNDKNLTRKPFADLNVNQNYIEKGTKHLQPLKYNTENINKYSSKNKSRLKRSHFKTVKKNQSSLKGNEYLTHSQNIHSKKPKKSLKIFDDCLQDEMLQKPDDESGIVIDDEPIVIDDSQDTINDKDKQAWLAVIEASKKEGHECTPHSSEVYSSTEAHNKLTRLSVEFDTTKHQDIKVPFYKKSYLSEICQYCEKETIGPEKPKEIKITIESDSFSTTIKVNNNVRSVIANQKKSVPVQTKISECQTDYNFSVTTENMNTPINMQVKDLNESNNGIMKIPPLTDSLEKDAFSDAGKTFENLPLNATLNEKTGLVIEESDSDDDIESSGPMYVTVDIHRSCDEEIGVLAEIENQEAHCARPRHAPRGHTPTSTDSSEKENFDPNRHKRIRLGKKKYVKK